MPEVDHVWRKVAICAIAAAGAAAAPGPAAAARPDPLRALKSSCRARTSPDKAHYRICSGMVKSFDGTPLDVTVTLPAKKTKRKLPLIAFLHGFLADKTEYLSETKNGTGPDRGANAYKTVHWNNVWFASRGKLLKLAAVVPTYTWTDLLYSLAPNGRHLSTGFPRANLRDPTGIAKQTLIDGFLATAGSRLPQQTYTWLARVNAGEPYDNPPDPVIEQAKRALTIDRSAYYQDGYFAALRAHRVRRVPVLAGQGWTDPIFPPIEALRMYRRLRQISPGYPIQLYLGDFEHLTALAKVPDLASLHALGNRLLDHYLKRRGKRPRFDVRAAITRCDPGRSGRWVAPGGARTLVTRGAYRGSAAQGRIVYELYGNAWRIRPGHRLQLELLQDDSTFLRPDNVLSTVTIERARLELPVR